MSDDNYNDLRQCALRLGSKVSEWQGKNSVPHDKMTSHDICAKYNLHTDVMAQCMH